MVWDSGGARGWEETFFFFCLGRSRRRGVAADSLHRARRLVPLPLPCPDLYLFLVANPNGHHHELQKKLFATSFRFANSFSLFLC
jgi:hypothetical protein